MLLLSSKDATNNVITLNQYIQGDYELIHHHVEHITPNAIDATNKGIRVTCIDTTEEHHHELAFDLTEMETLNIDTIVSDINTNLNNNALITVTVSKVNDTSLTITLTEGSLEINWADVDARVLFENTNGTITYEPLSTITLTLTDRTNIKHFELYINETFSNIITSNNTQPDLILSGYEDQTLDQTITFPTLTNTITFNVKEYRGNVNWASNDIPDIYLILKKTTNLKNQTVFISHQDLDSSGVLHFNKMLEGVYTILYSSIDPVNVNVINNYCNQIYTSIGNVTLTEQSEFNPETLLNDLNSTLSKQFVYLLNNNNYTFTTSDLSTFTIDWTNNNSTFNKIMNKTSNETTNAISIPTNAFPNATPPLINIKFAESNSIQNVYSNTITDLCIPQEDGNAAGQKLFISTPTLTLTPTFYRTLFSDIQIPLNTSWVILMN